MTQYLICLLSLTHHMYFLLNDVLLLKHFRYIYIFMADIYSNQIYLIVILTKYQNIFTDLSATSCQFLDKLVVLTFQFHVFIQDKRK
jgi:hypothetical protein